jgi:predicted ATPase with chaperone activity
VTEQGQGNTGLTLHNTMLARLHTFSLLGIEALTVEVEVGVSPRATVKTILVGLPEAAVVESLEVISVSNLAETLAFFQGELDIDAVPSRLDELFRSLSNYDVCYSDVRGQALVKRALTIAAAGSHNLLMLGPPGSGKTMYMARYRTDDPSIHATR